MSFSTRYLVNEDTDAGILSHVKCPECGRTVSCDEEVCPECGEYIDHTRTKDDSEDIYEEDEDDLGADYSDSDDYEADEEDYEEEEDYNDYRYYTDEEYYDEVEDHYWGED
jgi:hypothetical protein